MSTNPIIKDPELDENMEGDVVVTAPPIPPVVKVSTRTKDSVVRVMSLIEDLVVDGEMKFFHQIFETKLSNLDGLDPKTYLVEKE